MKPDNILNVAAQLFAERGFFNTSTSLLAKESGVSEATIFRHFKNKAEILTTLMGKVRDRLINDMDIHFKMSNLPNGLEKIVAIPQACYSFVRGNHLEFALFFRDAPVHIEESPETSEAVKTTYDHILNLISDMVQEGQADGSIRTDLEPNELSMVIMCSVFGLARSVHFRLMQPTDKVFDTQAELFRSSLSNNFKKNLDT